MIKNLLFYLGALFFCLFVTTNCAFAQAPGNVEPNNLVMWLKADTGGINWTDQSTAGNNVTTSGDPTLVPLGINFNPAIDFDGSGDFYTTTNTGIIGTNNSYTKIAVVLQRAETGTFNIISGSDTNTTTGSNHALFFFDSYHPRSYHNDVAFPSFGSTPPSTDPMVQQNIGAIIGTRYGSGGPDNIVFVNAQDNIDTNTPPFSDETTTHIGNFANSAFVQNGYIAEVIVYNSEISDTDLNKIESYLAIKYGVTLDASSITSYVASNGTDFWTKANNTGYMSSIFGIGRDDVQLLNQKISKSVNTGSILTVSLDTDFSSPNNDPTRASTNFDDTLDFIMFAHNGDATSTQTTELDATTNFVERISREWKVQNTGNVGTVNLKFEGYDDTWSLITTPNGDFSSGVTTVGALSVAGTIATTLADGVTFTLAKANQNPIPINDLVLWLDGEDVDGDSMPEGTSEAGLSGAEVITWTDKSGLGNHVSAVASNRRPELNVNQLNGKPTLDFADDRLLTASTGQITPNGSYTKFVVFKYDVTNTSNNLISSDLSGTAFWGAGSNSLSVWNVDPAFQNAPGHLTAGGIGTTNYHIGATRYDNVANDGNLSVLNLNGEEVDTDDGQHPHDLFGVSIGAHGNGNFLDGQIAEAIVYNRSLTDAEIDAVETYLSDKWGIPLVSNTIALNKTNYPQYKVFQRNGSDQYDFTLSGTYTGNPTAIEASFDGNTYTVIDANPTGGNWSGTLASQSIGQGRLSVRFVNDTSVEDGVDDIGIGDVYVVAGQSNAEGHALSQQSYTTVAPTATVFPTVYTEADVWKIGNDETDPGGNVGSAWPIVGGYIVEHTGIPVAFITTATGATGLVNPGDWQRGSGAYNVMPAQVNEANPNAVKAVLWFQGESDAFYRVNRNAYNAGLDQLLLDIHTDLPGTPDLVSGVIGPWTIAQGGANDPSTEQIRLATIDAWDDNPGILYGPQTYDIEISNDGVGDDIHFQTNDEIQTLGFRWWKALEAHYYSGTSGRGPVISAAELLLGNTQVELTFTTSSPLLPASGLASDIWFVNNNGSAVTVTNAEVTATNKVTLTLASAIVTPNNVTVSYAKDNSAEGKAVLTDSTTGNTAQGVSALPADVFTDFPVLIAVNYTFNNGWSPANPNGIATNVDDLTVVAGDAIISTNTNSNTITVNAGASLTVNAGVTLNASSGVLLESTSTSYSSLILDGSITGNITYERHVNSAAGSGTTTGNNDLISPPLSGQTFGAFRAANPNILSGTIGGNPAFLFGPFNNTTEVYENYAASEDATVLTSGLGYRTGSTDNGTYTFSGTPLNSTVSVPIDATSTNKWHLIGNPYPSYLNVQDFLNEAINSGLIDENAVGVYGYDGSATDGWVVYNLATTNSNTVITPGQGFFVLADATGNITFTPAMRTTGTDDDFIAGRNSALQYLKIGMASNSDNFTTDFYFNDNATRGLDQGYDASLWGSVAPSFSIYSNLVQNNTGVPLAIQSLNSQDFSNTTVPLGVNANANELLSFSIVESTLPSHIDVYLDNTINQTTTLLNSGSYQFTPNQNLNGTGNFYLRFVESALSITNSELDKLIIFTNKEEKQIGINGRLTQPTYFELYDLQGRLVRETALNSQLILNTVDVSTLAKGVYVVKLRSKNLVKTQKLILN